MRGMVAHAREYMTQFRLQEYKRQPTDYSPFTYGRILKKVYGDRQEAIDAAKMLLSSNCSGVMLRILDGSGAQAWSSDAPEGATA